MNSMTKTLVIAVILLIPIVAGLALALVLGGITGDQFVSLLGKTALVVGIGTLAILAIIAVAGIVDKK